VIPGPDFTGTSCSEEVFGNELGNLISTLGGDDFVLAGDGDDTVLLGDGDDVALGGDGDDSIAGGAGDDYIDG
jgi:Ca2+-binding RTX toxin-like protein